LKAGQIKDILETWEQQSSPRRRIHWLVWFMAGRETSSLLGEIVRKAKIFPWELLGGTTNPWNREWGIFHHWLNPA
jgi:hypothetical protein